MSIVNPNGSQAYWWNGLPFNGVKLGTNDSGNMQFWFNGVPNQYLFPASGGSGPANLKSLDTNIKSNIKSYNGNPLANIKSINTNA